MGQLEHAGSVAAAPRAPPAMSELPRSSEIEAVSIHDLVPRSDEVMHELLLRVALPIDFCKSTKL